jgi:hypothetical protein
VKCPRILFFLFALPILNLAQTPEPLTNQRVLQLVASGVRADELTRMIASAPSVIFNLTPADTDALLRAGVTEGAIKMMASRQQGQNYGPAASKSHPISDSRPRVFVNDSPNAITFGSSHPQTAEIIKTIGHECLNVVVTNNLQKANYVVTLEHEALKGVVWRDNKMAVFNQDGDLVYSASTRALGSAVRGSCSFFK